MSDESVAVVRKLYDAFVASDTETLSALLAECTFHIPGENLIAGTYGGTDEILGMFAHASELSEGTIEFAIHDIVGAGEHAVALDRVTGRRSDGRTIDLNRIVIVNVEGDRISEIWLNVEDQYAFDDFWS